jgi:hypothetical protein
MQRLVPFTASNLLASVLELDVGADQQTVIAMDRAFPSQASTHTELRLFFDQEIAF